MCMQTFYRFIRRLLLSSGLWWMLVGKDTASWYLGAAIILPICLWNITEVIETQESRFRFWRLTWFVPYFLWRSVVGSCDVAWRAMHWSLPISPAMLSYPFRLPSEGFARVVFANCLSLSPGTLSVAWQEDTLLVHLITDSPESAAAVRRLESQVAWMFGHALPIEENIIQGKRVSV